MPSSPRLLRLCARAMGAGKATEEEGAREVILVGFRWLGRVYPSEK